MKSPQNTAVQNPLLEASVQCRSMADYLERVAFSEPSTWTGYDPNSAYARLDRLERAAIEILRAQAILLETLGGKDD